MGPERGDVVTGVVAYLMVGACLAWVVRRYAAGVQWVDVVLMVALWPVTVVCVAVVLGHGCWLEWRDGRVDR
jgi:hypothetical protein